MNGPDTERLIREIAEYGITAEDLAYVAEALPEVERMFQREDQGWQKWKVDDESGFSLHTLKEISGTLRELAVGNSLVGRAIHLRFAYQFSKGVEPMNPSTLVKRVLKNQVNRENFFCEQAWEEMERAAGTDGMFFLIADRQTRTARRIGISEIGAVMSNPDFDDEVWAYRRDWESNGVQRRMWFYTDRYSGPVRQSMADRDGSRVPIHQTARIVDARFNGQVGWKLGVPDAISGGVWAQEYSEMVGYGKNMTRALARFVAKVTGAGPKSKAQIGAALKERGVGQTAALPAGMDLQVLATAGKTYNFDGLRPVAALVATSFRVSVIHLLSDPGAAGSSYGSASNLDAPTKQAMKTRRVMWGQFLERVIRVLTDQDVEFRFPSIDDPDPYREMQVATMAWNSGVIHDDEMRDRAVAVAGITPTHDSAPDGVMIPNNEESVMRKDVDLDGSGPPKTAPSPDQGRSNGGGGVDSTLNNDIQ